MSKQQALIEPLHSLLDASVACQQGEQMALPRSLPRRQRSAVSLVEPLLVPLQKICEYYMLQKEKGTNSVGLRFAFESWLGNSNVCCGVEGAGYVAVRVV